MIDHKIMLILPYFGKLPNYFQLWLNSASVNSEIDWLIFTDDEDILNPNSKKFICSSNIHIERGSLDDIRDKLSDILDFSFVLHNAYKLCDYKPLYGLIFQDYLRKYDFWGWCDPDIIWGQFTDFISDEMLEKYDRLFVYGHLSIIRNVDYMNRAPLIVKKGFFCIKDFLSMKYVSHFDEGNLLRMFYRDAGGKEFLKYCYADILVPKKQFKVIQHGEVAAFEWKQNGQKCILCEYLKEDDEFVKKEILYVHLQKRKMEFSDNLNLSHFLIIPNKFITAHTLEKKDLLSFMQADSVYEKNYQDYRKKSRWKNFISGAWKIRIKNMWKK